MLEPETGPLQPVSGRIPGQAQHVATDIRHPPAVRRRAVGHQCVDDRSAGIDEMLELAARALELILDPGLDPLLPADQPEQQGGREQDEQLALEGLGLRDSGRLTQQLQGQPVGAPDPDTGQHEVDQADPDRGRDSGHPEGLRKKQMRTPTGWKPDTTTA